MKKTIEETLRQLLSLMGEKEFQLQLEKGKKEWLVSLEVPNPALLIGYRGKSLESFQLILKMLVSKKRGSWPIIVVDVNGYRAKQKERLLSLAQKAANEAKLAKRPISLLPMSPFERRLIHISLSDDPEVETVSEGEGDLRRVVIKPKG